jgi:diphosphomevalonate decarboxylase
MLDEIRGRASLVDGADVVSSNRFPTAAGLASSASGFAALALAASRAAGLDLSETELSRMARRASASAARSIFGGFSELPAGKPGNDRLAAKSIASASHWDVRIVVALATKERKSVGSTEGMERSRRTSPYYDAWIAVAPKLAGVVRRAIRARDLERLGRAMEQSTLAFHACAIASDPGIVYWRPTTIALLDAVRTLRDAGVSAWATMDAGPHVKVLCAARDAARVRRTVARVDGVVGTIVCKPGPGIR